MSMATIKSGFGIIWIFVKNISILRTIQELLGHSSALSVTISPFENLSENHFLYLLSI